MRRASLTYLRTDLSSVYRKKVALGLLLTHAPNSTTTVPSNSRAQCSRLVSQELHKCSLFASKELNEKELMFRRNLATKPLSLQDLTADWHKASASSKNSSPNSKSTKGNLRKDEQRSPSAPLPTQNLSLVAASQKLREAVTKNDIDSALSIALDEFKYMPGFRELLLDHALYVRGNGKAKPNKSQKSSSSSSLKGQSNPHSSCPDAIVFNMLIRVLILNASRAVEQHDSRMVIALNPGLSSLSIDSLQKKSLSKGSSSETKCLYPTPSNPFQGLSGGGKFESELLSTLKNYIADSTDGTSETNTEESQQRLLTLMKELDKDIPKYQVWSDEGVLTALRTLDYMQYLASHPSVLSKLRIGDEIKLDEDNTVHKTNGSDDKDQLYPCPRVDLSVAPDVRSFLPLARIAATAGDAILAQALIVRIHKWGVLRRAGSTMSSKKNKQTDDTSRFSNIEELKINILTAIGNKSFITLDRYTMYLTLWDAMTKSLENEYIRSEEHSVVVEGEWPTWLWPPSMAFTSHPAFMILDDTNSSDQGHPNDSESKDKAEVSNTSSSPSSNIVVASPPMRIVARPVDAPTEGEQDAQGAPEFAYVPLLHPLGSDPCDLSPNALTPIVSSFAWPKLWSEVFDSARTLFFLEQCTSTMCTSSKSDKQSTIILPRHPAIEWATSPGKLTKLISFSQATPRTFSETLEILGLAVRKQSESSEPSAQDSLVLLKSNLLRSILRLCELLSLHSFGLMLPNALPDPVSSELAQIDQNAASKLRKEVADGYGLVTRLTAQRRAVLDGILVRCASEFNICVTRAIWARPIQERNSQTDNVQEGFVKSSLKLKDLKSNSVSNVYWPLSSLSDLERHLQNIPRLRLAYPDPSWVLDNMKRSVVNRYKLVVDISDLPQRNPSDYADLRATQINSLQNRLQGGSIVFAVEPNHSRACALMMSLLECESHNYLEEGKSQESHLIHPRLQALKGYPGLVTPSLNSLVYSGTGAMLLGAVPIASLDAIRIVNPTASSEFAWESLLLAARALRPGGSVFIVTSDDRVTRQLASLFVHQQQGKVQDTRWKGLPVFNGEADILDAIQPRSGESISRPSDHMTRLFSAFEVFDESEEYVGSFSDYANLKGARKGSENDAKNEELNAEMQVRCYRLIRSSEEWI